VDGKSATAWGANSCTYTEDKGKAWWIVDLGKGEQVTEVYIVNRDVLGGRLSNFEIRVGRLLFLISPDTFIYAHMYMYRTVQLLLPQPVAKKIRVICKCVVSF